jgi:hypothetical protein
MLSRVTIVAKRPSGVSEAQGHDSGNIFIETVGRRLATATDTSNNEHRLLYASSVGDVAGLLADKTHAPPDILQIVGHGYPGGLKLGSCWTSDYVKRSEQGQDVDFFTLDSNPYCYALLAEVQLKPSTQVWLIGCDVGNPKPRFGNVDGGRVLLFALEQMWRREISVWASYDVVVPADFDADSGLFMGNRTRYNNEIKSAGWPGKAADQSVPWKGNPTKKLWLLMG